MKKLLLLIPLLFLCSCGNRTLKDTYNFDIDRKDGYAYKVDINYDNGSLHLLRCSNKGGEPFVTYKSFNDYEIVNNDYKSILYDYGDYAIYIGRLS